MWRSILLILLSILSGCGRSGTWENDAGNWQRAFGSAQLENVEVVHSWYWRSPHFTYEFEYFFALAPNESFRKQLLDSGNLLDAAPVGNEEREKIQQFFHNKPGWFVPKPIENYEVWRGKRPRDQFRLFIDRQTGEIFLTDFSV